MMSWGFTALVIAAVVFAGWCELRRSWREAAAKLHAHIHAPRPAEDCADVLDDLALIDGTGDAEAFVALSMAYLRRNPKLADAANRNPASFMSALSECARLGLVPGDTYHCVPFEDRRNNTVEITGIIDYTEIAQSVNGAPAAGGHSEPVYEAEIVEGELASEPAVEAP